MDPQEQPIPSWPPCSREFHSVTMPWVEGISTDPQGRSLSPHPAYRQGLNQPGSWPGSSLGSMGQPSSSPWDCGYGRSRPKNKLDSKPTETPTPWARHLPLTMGSS